MSHRSGTMRRVSVLIGESGLRWGDVAAWLGAAASFAAVGTAMWLARRPERLARKSRPELAIEHGEVEPFERAMMVGDQIGEYRLRVGVRNDGATTARRVRVTIERWWSFTGRPTPWLANPIDPVSAEWVGQDVYGGAEAFALDIPSHGRGLCGILTWRQATQDLVLTVNPRRQEWNPVGGGPFGEQRIEFTVSCENAESQRAVLSVTLTAGVPRVDATNRVLQAPMHDVHLSGEPQSHEVESRGLGGLWNEDGR